MKFIEFTTKVSNLRTFRIFENIVPNLYPLRKYTSKRNTIGSGLKRVATGSVSKRYQTSLFAQLSTLFLENVNFHLFVQYLLLNKL